MKTLGREHIGIFALASALLVVWLTQTMESRGADMAGRIVYFTNLVDDVFPTEFIVEPNGMATLVVRSNRRERTQPIGIFRAQLPESVLAHIGRSVENQNFRRSPSQEVLVPDETYRQITMMQIGGGKTVKRVGEAMASPPEFLAAENAMQPAIEMVRQNPTLGLSMTVGSFPAEIGSGEPQPFVVVLTNVGRGPFQIDPPKAWGGEGTAGEIMALRSDIAEAELRSEHQSFVNLNGSLVREYEPKPEEGPIELAPGQRLVVTFAIPFDWPNGQYAVDIALTVLLRSQSAQQEFRAEVVGSPIEIKIQFPERDGRSDGT